ncbi:ATP-binding protein [Methylobacterium sp. 092160098-2]|uniref:ATP-binding protein n=1 Tax=Methylobacterium sp. 092160098-2 TaxID=3025129 RepID=UPI002381C107|nr:ATP-binding protein [Methylobacterium sp. 092160098-2]MDE4911233.1 ATP-binding protein [Methylobacterium sp. 092160098-2]
MSQPEFWDEAWSVPARTIDMLGRQQIANIPTALHELFKNAHDAYADRVVADYFRQPNVFVIRDDGDGMTPDQLRKGWLTLASSVKAGANAAREQAENEGHERPRRKIMGEKGIGRLAIASIGPQVLILTRPRPISGVTQPLLVSLVHWGVNKLPDVDLSRVAVPTMRLDGGDLPDAAAIRTLCERLADNVGKMRTPANGIEIDLILKDIAGFDVDPAADLGAMAGPTLADGGHGTQFIIRPTEKTLAFDLQKANDEDVSQVEKYLLGFSNTMMPDRPPPSIVATFNDHREDGTVKTPIGSQEFFTPDDFASADHSIEGRFDEHGHFRGRISVYGSEHKDHEIAWRNATNDPSRCGPFRITFAYLQGAMADTLLPPEKWQSLSVKLNRLGGLYVYRDGIRILPYGGPDQDFLGIERRRTKSASDWFFSYRRMFGAVEITYPENKDLKEKAGREGFIRDGAYNDFVSILSGFFEKLAYDFFRDSSKHGDWSETKSRLNRDAALLAKRERSAKAKLARFTKRLDGFFARLEAGEFTREAERIRQEVRERLDNMTSDPEGGGTAVLAIEADLRRAKDALSAKLVLTRPQGAGLSKSKAADWDAYQRNVARIRNELIGPLDRETAEMIEQAINAKGLNVDRRRRLAKAIDDKGQRVVAQAERVRISVDKRLEELRTEVTTSVRTAIAGLSSKVEGTRITLSGVSTGGLDERAFEGMRIGFENEIEASSRDTREMLEALAGQLGNLMEAVRGGVTLDETTDAIETRSEAYREQLDQYVELAQLGTAVGIVQHEFASAVIRVRGAIEQLDWWAKSNPGLEALDRDLRAGFEHIDAYLDLFAPLSKRLSRTAVTISGREIRTYLDEVFGDRMRRHGIRVETARDFDGGTLAGQPSAILAAFVNLMDNAIHWLCTMPAGERLVRFGCEGAGLTIANSGPGIEARNADRIFEFGETTRTGGRGMGLYVSREALRRSDLELTLLDAGAARNPRFMIAPAVADEETETDE